MTIKLLRGSKEFTTIQSAREYIKEYLIKHNDDKRCTFLVCQYTTSYGDDGKKTFTATDFIYDETFANVINFIISAKKVYNWHMVKYNSL